MKRLLRDWLPVSQLFLDLLNIHLVSLDSEVNMSSATRILLLFTYEAPDHVGLLQYEVIVSVSYIDNTQLPVEFTNRIRPIIHLELESYSLTL